MLWIAAGHGLRHGIHLRDAPAGWRDLRPLPAARGDRDGPARAFLLISAQRFAQFLLIFAYYWARFGAKCDQVFKPCPTGKQTDSA